MTGTASSQNQALCPCHWHSTNCKALASFSTLRANKQSLIPLLSLHFSTLNFE